MKLHKSDQALLLLAHDELSAWSSVAAQAHLAFCPRCQTRFTKLAGASRLVADAVRGDDLPRWRSIAPSDAIASARLLTARRLATALMLVMTAALLSQTIVRLHRNVENRSVPGTWPSNGCRPDLPNDKCR